MIAPISTPAQVGLVPAGGATGPGPDGTFAQALDQAVDAVNRQVTEADKALFGLASGTDVDLHGAMIALQEAEIGLRAMVSVRDKVIGAYEQLLNLAI